MPTALMAKPFTSRLVLGLVVLGSVSALAMRTAGQESYRTQQALRPHGVTTAAATTPATPTKPLRFRGWRESAKQGPDAVRYFESLTRRPQAMPHGRPGYSPTVAQSTRVALASPEAAPANGYPGIQLRPSLPAGAIPSSVVTGDFNGDGKLDWAVANAGDNTVYIYLGKGDGTSQLPIIVPLLGQSPVGIAAGDLNGDGKVDLAVAEADSGTVGILFGKGDGTFQAETEISAGDAAPMAVAMADLNGDKHLDLVVAIVSDINGTTFPDFDVFLNSGTGSFGPAIPAPQFITDGIDEGLGISIADLNGDGIPDLLINGLDAFSSWAKTFIGKGDGTFTTGAVVWSGNPAVGSDIAGVVLADLNGDGCPDLAVSVDYGWVNTFLNDCKGNYPADPTTWGMGDTSWGLAVVDVNGDGHPDIVSGSVVFYAGPYGSEAGDSLSVRLNDGTGNFGPARLYRGDPGMFNLAAADLKGNGRPEIISANQQANSVTVYANDGSGGFGEPFGGEDGFLEGVPTSPVNAPASADLVADVNGDGKPDLALMERAVLGSNDSMGTLTILLNQGNGQFSSPIRSPMVTENAIVFDFVLADFRKTGQLDYVAIVADQSAAGSAILYAQNMGNGQFGAPVTLPFPGGDQFDFGSIGVGDFNHDGKLDFVLATPTNLGTSDELIVYLGNGDGTFAAPTTVTFGDGANGQAVFVGDANGDGKQDIFVWLGDNGGIGTGLYEFLGNGDGTFKTPVEVLSGVTQMTMKDLNHDGLLDVIDIESITTGATPGSLPPTINIYLGQSNGTFSAPRAYAPYAGTFYSGTGVGLSDFVSHFFAPYVGDFNGDGNWDLAIFQQNAVFGGPSWVQFMMGNADGTFTPTFDVFQLDVQQIPELSAYNLFGDGYSSLVQTPAFTSGYQVIPAAAAPSFQMEMAAIPVVGGSDAIVISLNVPSSSNTTIALAASDPNVQIAASATVPTGQLSVQVPFTLTSNYPTDHWFSITGTAGTTSASANNFPLSAGLQTPFLLTITGGFIAPTIGNFSTPGPGETSIWNTTLGSNGVGTGTFQISCSGLPASASCTDFAPQNLSVEAGASNGNTFSITTEPSIAPGDYPFTVGASDGFTSVNSPAVLRVGDFSLALSPASVSVAATGSANYMLATTLEFGYGQPVTVSCSGLPTGATCALQGQTIQLLESGSQSFLVDLTSVAAGTYKFTVTATDGIALTNSTTAQLIVTGGPITSLSQSAIAFGQTLVGGASSAPAITLTNSGNTALNLNSIVAAASGGSSATYAQSNTCGAAVAPSASCTITVSLTPAAVGLTSGTLTLTDNAANSPQVVTLSGSGADFTMTATASSTSVTAGQTASYMLQITPNQLSGSIGFTCSGAPAQATCVLPANSIFFAPGAGAAQLPVGVTTTARGNVPPPTADFRNRGVSGFVMMAAVSLGLIAFVVLLRSPQPKWRYALRTLALLATLGVLPSCGGGGTGGGGGGGGNTGTPAGTYTLIVTGQYNGGSHTIALTLIVN